MTTRLTARLTTRLTTRHFRLASGLVMLCYLSQHLVTHMLGIGSLALAEDGLRLSIHIWQTPLGTLLLYGAFAVHFALALYILPSVFRVRPRRSTIR